MRSPECNCLLKIDTEEPSLSPKQLQYEVFGKCICGLEGIISVEYHPIFTRMMKNKPRLTVTKKGNGLTVELPNFSEES